MFWIDLFHWVTTLVIVPAARYTEELSPLIDLRSAVCMHRAMNHHRRHSSLVDFGNLVDIRLISRIRKTLIMNHDIVTLGPVGIII